MRYFKNEPRFCIPPSFHRRSFGLSWCQSERETGAPSPPRVDCTHLQVFTLWCVHCAVSLSLWAVLQKCNSCLLNMLCFDGTPPAGAVYEERPWRPRRASSKISLKDRQISWREDQLVSWHLRVGVTWPLHVLRASLRSPSRPASKHVNACKFPLPPSFELTSSCSRTLSAKRIGANRRRLCSGQCSLLKWQHNKRISTK